MEDSYVKRDDGQQVLDKERQHILGGAPTWGEGKKGPYGLAISGGGIRSASFGMGVMQALAKNGILEKIDYLSTVSGGGYIGSALTWFLSQKDKDGRAKFGTTPENFPFGDISKKPTDSQNRVLNFIRQHGNYLTPGYGLDGFSLIAVALRAVLVSIFVYLSLLTVIMVPMHRLGLFTKNMFHCVAVGLGLFLFVWSLLYSATTFFLKSWKPEYLYKMRISAQTWFGRVLALWVVALVVGLFPIFHEWIRRYEMGGFAAVPAGVLTFIGTAIGFFHSKRCHDPEKKEGKGGPALIAAGALFLLIGLLFSAYLWAHKLSTSDAICTLALGAAAVIVGWCVNTNLLGIHRMYRDRLMETFLPDMENVETNRWGRATKANTAPIHGMCQSKPYHLINTNVVLSDSAESKYRGRGGENFILSPLYCGSVATGWRKSGDYMGKVGGMTLATAMAISGAAVNPNAGVAGQGPTTNRLISTLLSLLNIRTGYWAPNPDSERCCLFPPNFFSPGLKGGIFAGGLHEKASMIELTDGGHFENLGIYELIRRKAKLIIASDGSADPDYKFDDLGNAIERVWADFGVRIDFGQTEYPLKDVLPETADGDDLPRKKYKLAKRGFAIGKIVYDDKTEGTLIYLETTMIPGLPQNVYSYKSENPSFPDQATADQFFDEGQFEAYRELGYQIAKKMLEENAWPGKRWIK